MSICVRQIVDTEGGWGVVPGGREPGGCALRAGAASPGDAPEGAARSAESPGWPPRRGYSSSFESLRCMPRISRIDLSMCSLSFTPFRLSIVFRIPASLSAPRTPLSIALCAGVFGASYRQRNPFASGRFTLETSMTHGR